MAPKKRARKDDVASFSRAFDPSKFVSQEAIEQCTKLASLKFIREKGFVKPNGVLQRRIIIKGWTELCNHPDAIVAPIVREFYANLCGKRDGKIFVRD